MWPFSSVMLNALWRFLCPYVGNKLWVMGHWVCSVVCVMFPSSIMFCSGNYGWKSCVREIQSGQFVTPDVSGYQQPFFWNKNHLKDFWSFVYSRIGWISLPLPVIPNSENWNVLCIQNASHKGKHSAPFCALLAVCVICVLLLQFIQRFHSYMFKFANQPAVLCNEHHGIKIHACIKLLFALSHSVWRAQYSHFRERVLICFTSNKMKQQIV